MGFASEDFFLESKAFYLLFSADPRQYTSRRGTKTWKKDDCV